MARFILGTRPPDATPLAPASRSRAGAGLQGAALEARLRQRRSPGYVAAMTTLDAGAHVDGAAAVQAIADAIRNELGEVDVDSLPRGIVSRCRLGPPYEVHTLDCTGAIIRHYKSHESLPPPLESARSLALHPQYAFVEVYGRRLIAVGHDGGTAVVEIPGENAP